VRRKKKYGLELDEATSPVEGAGILDQRPAPSKERRRRIAGMRASDWASKPLAAELGIAKTPAWRDRPPRQLAMHESAAEVGAPEGVVRRARAR
jgi:hypothetical protein